MQGKWSLCSCRLRGRSRVLTLVFILIGLPGVPGASAQSPGKGGDIVIRETIASNVFLIPRMDTLQGFQTEPGHDKDSLIVKAVGHLDATGAVDVLGRALLINIRRYQKEPAGLPEPVALGQPGSYLRDYEIIRLTGELIGEGGSARVYGVEIVSSYEVAGEVHKVTAFDILGLADSRVEMDRIAEAHAGALGGGVFDALDGTHPGALYRREFRSSTSFGPPLCSECGNEWNAAVNFCDFVANVCVAAAVTTHVIAALACPATSPVLFTACIGAVDLSLSLSLGTCATNLHSCFVQAARDQDSCFQICDGPPGILP